jgi:aspartate/methionine/tyrosine aminotransferase
MEFPERFSNLPAYAFPRLRALLDPHPAGGETVHMTIGEPKHPMPDFLGTVLSEAVAQFANYPNNNGTPELLTAIASWIKDRYGVALDPETRLMALNGSREGLFNACLAFCPEQKRGRKPKVLIPNPFYQVYAVAAEMAGADPIFVPATSDTGFLPDFAGLPAEVLDDVTIAYICSPSNPQGAVASPDYWRDLLALAEKHDFRIFADECYSEVYRGDPPVGGLQMAAEVGADPERMTVFHSLSKRSNLPGLRSGFVASGPKSIKLIRNLRAYSGAPVPGPIQHVSARVWADEAHVDHSRALYVEKFELADAVFEGMDGYRPPQAGFFLWLPVDNGEEAALRLWQETGVRVLPGQYLSRPTPAGDPGAGYIRVALVHDKHLTETGLRTIRSCLY